MRNKLFLIRAGWALGFLLTGPFFCTLSADEIVLTEGKTVTGRITNETETEVTIQSGKKMVLTFSKSKIQKIIRSDENSKPKAPVVTLQSPVAAGTSTANVSLGIPPPPVKSDLYNPSAGIKYREIKKDNLILKETVVSQIYHIRGSTPSRIAESIYDSKIGHGYLLDKERIASNTQFKFSWAGKAGKEGGQAKWENVIIQSTSTLTLPYLDEPEKIDPKLALAWQDLAKAIETHAESELKIYSNSMVSLGESLLLLRRNDEASLKTDSELLFKQAIERADKQKIGFNRSRRVDWKKILNLE